MDSGISFYLRPMNQCNADRPECRANANATPSHLIFRSLLLLVLSSYGSLALPPLETPLHHLIGQTGYNPPVGGDNALVFAFPVMVEEVSESLAGSNLGH